MCWKVNKCQLNLPFIAKNQNINNVNENNKNEDDNQEKVHESMKSV